MRIQEQDEPTTVAAVRRATVRMDELGSFYDTAYRQVAAAVAAVGGRIVGPAIGWYHGMPTDTADVAGGFPVTGVALGALPGDCDVVEIPGGRVIVGHYVGSYDGLGEAWSQVEQWRVKRGFEGRGDFWEVYVTEPSPDGDPAANETLLVLPLR